MNKYFKFSVVALTALVMVFGLSCKDDDKKVDDVPTLSVTPSVTEVEFTVEGTADNTTFTIATNQGYWRVTKDQAWLTVSVTSTHFILSADRAGINVPPATVTVTAGEAKPVTINVRQTAAIPVFAVTPTVGSVVLTASGIAATLDGNPFASVFNVSTNMNWTVAVSAGGQSWLKVDKQTNSFKLSASENTEPQERNATVTVSAGDFKEIITVTQKFSATPLSLVEITKDVLVNYEAPFKTGALLYSLFNCYYWYDALGWNTNLAGKANGNVQNSCDTYGDGPFYRLMIGYGIATEEIMKNGKLYQTVELDAGEYRLTFDVSHAKCEAYVTAALGNNLPDMENFATQAIAYAPIEAVGQVSIEFVLTRKQTLSLGIVANAGADKCAEFTKVELWSYQ